MPRRQLLLVASILAYCTTSNAGVNVFTPTGASGGYASAISFHPTSQVVLAGSGHTIYRSTNLGQTWAGAPNVFDGINAIVIDPLNPDRILASGVGDAPIRLVAVERGVRG